MVLIVQQYTLGMECGYYDIYGDGLLQVTTVALQHFMDNLHFRISPIEQHKMPTLYTKLEKNEHLHAMYNPFSPQVDTPQKAVL